MDVRCLGVGRVRAMFACHIHIKLLVLVTENCISLFRHLVHRSYIFSTHPTILSVSTVKADELKKARPRLMT